VLVVALEILIGVIAAVIDIIAATANIIGTVLEAGTAFCNFVEGVPGAIQGAVDTVARFFTDLWNSIKDALDNAGQAVEKFARSVQVRFEFLKNKVVGVVLGIVNAIASLPGNVASALSSFASTLWNVALNAMYGMANGVAQGVNTVLSFFYDIPSRILDYLGNLGDLLWNAGWNILMGFYNGAVAAWNNMVGWLSNIGGWIQNLKGPLDYDKKLLIENGQAIMAGLQKGLEMGYEDVADTVSGMGLDIASNMQVNPSVNRVDNGIMSEIAALREELRQMRLVLNIDGRAFAEATVGEIDRAMGTMSRRAVAR